jgi:hypothetical protein
MRMKDGATRVPRWPSRRGLRMGLGMQACCAINPRRVRMMTGMHGHPQVKAWIRGAPPLSPISAQTRRCCVDLRSFTIVTSVAMALRYYDMVSKYRLAGRAHCGRCLYCHLVDEGIPWQSVQAVTIAARVTEADQHPSWPHEFLRAVFR